MTAVRLLLSRQQAGSHASLANRTGFVTTAQSLGRFRSWNGTGGFVMTAQSLGGRNPSVGSPCEDGYEERDGDRGLQRSMFCIQVILGMFTFRALTAESRLIGHN